MDLHSATAGETLKARGVCTMPQTTRAPQSRGMARAGVESSHNGGGSAATAAGAPAEAVFERERRAHGHVVYALRVDRIAAAMEVAGEHGDDAPEAILWAGGEVAGTHRSRLPQPPLLPLHPR